MRAYAISWFDTDCDQAFEVIVHSEDAAESLKGILTCSEWTRDVEVSEHE